MIMVLDILQYDKHSSCVEQVINHYGKVKQVIDHNIFILYYECID